MPVLSLSLPVLADNEQLLCFTRVSEKGLEEWVAHVAVMPHGLAFRHRVELLERLHGEDSRADMVASGAVKAEVWLHDDGASNNHPASSDEDEEQGGRQQAASRKKKFVKLTDEDLLVNWYEILKLEDQDGATENQIRSAYRRRCLETHPDKQADHSDALFKQVQRAFDILGDPEIRLAYDSSRPFDDSIPGETVAEENFYTTFGPVFERNKKWNRERGLPSLGSDKTSYTDVLKFYDAWSRFQSWRDFSHLVDLEEIHDGMCREEKRYYMRENERELSHYVREEKKRLSTLLERARKNDPRIRRKREEDEMKRQREQAERENFRRQLMEEEIRRRNEEKEKERARKEEELRLQQEAKNTIRNSREGLLEFLETTGLLSNTSSKKFSTVAVPHPNIRWLFSKISSPEEATAAHLAVTTASTDKKQGEEEEEVEAVTVFNKLVTEKERQVGFTRFGEAVKKTEPKEKPGPTPNAPPTAAPCPEWTDDDLARLQKATAKYPPGTVERWRKITTLLRDKFTEEQAMKKVNELTAALHSGAAVSDASPTAADPVEDWTVKQQKQLEQGLRDLKDYKEKDKFQKIAKMVEGKTAKECFERFKFLCSVNKKK